MLVSFGQDVQNCSLNNYTMKVNAYWGVLILLFISITTPAQTCDSITICECAASDLSPAGQMLGHEHPKGVWKASYRLMNMNMGGLISGSQTVSENNVLNNYMMSPSSMRMDMHMVMAMYGFTDRFSLMLMFNYNSFDMQMNMSLNPTIGHTHSMPSDESTIAMQSKTAGLGDTKLYGSYVMFNSAINYFFLNGGLSIPTGSIKMKGNANDVMYPSKRLPYMMQMGSGTFDFMPGLTYLANLNNAAISIQLKTVIHPYNNSLGYRLGDQIGLNVWGAYKWFPWLSNSLRLEASSTKPIIGNDPSVVSTIEPSANAHNYGGQTATSYFGVNIYFDRSFLSNNRLSVEYGIPLYQNLNGTQQAKKSTLHLGWLISF